jgi:hypothetical protein
MVCKLALRADPRPNAPPEQQPAGDARPTSSHEAEEVAFGDSGYRGVHKRSEAKGPK